jgi:murein DD-endopeptidase MepM/ murein hydrolase activator NlpD
MYLAPVYPLIVTSRFGPRPPIMTNGRVGPLHPGVDLRAAVGQEVYAVADGKVIDSHFSANSPPDWKPGEPIKLMGYGNFILIQHPNGDQSAYAHMSLRKVQIGEEVHAGELIGLAGNEGYSFGSHLHFEIRRPVGDHRPGAIDPLPELPPAQIL